MLCAEASVARYRCVYVSASELEALCVLLSILLVLLIAIAVHCTLQAIELYGIQQYIAYLQV
jgi:hypothetical protein